MARAAAVAVPNLPALVPLLAMKLAMSTFLPSTVRFRMQPTNCRLCTGKASGRLGTPPKSRGPVRSRDLGMQSRPVRPLGQASRRRRWGPDAAIPSRWPMPPDTPSTDN